MSAFMIIACKMHDRDKFINDYGKIVPDLVAEFDGEYIIVAPGAELLEGNLKGYESVAISKWPTKDSALRFWQSDKYKKLKELRQGLADVEVILVETPS
tara:strand:- start:238 stop:534 length:297 start_codon:yes stop_codon:yes gene_type:complete